MARYQGFLSSVAGQLRAARLSPTTSGVGKKIKSLPKLSHPCLLSQGRRALGTLLHANLMGQMKEVAVCPLSPKSSRAGSGRAVLSEAAVMLHVRAIDCL